MNKTLARLLILLSFLCFVLCARPQAAAAAAPVTISEAGAANGCTVFDENGNTPDWVELYNAGAEDITLAGWALCDRADGRDALLLDDITVPAGGYALVCLPAEGFGLSAAGETVYLLQGGAVVDQLRCPALEKDVSCARFAQGELLTYLPTPGAENMLLAEGEAFEPVGDIRFSEFRTSAAPFKDTQGNDWLEITNTGSRKVNLKGYVIRLGMAGAKSYTLGSQYLSSGYYLGIYCSDDALKSLNTGFNLPAQNALLSLWSPAGELLDFVRLGTQYANISCGREKGAAALVYFADSTFGGKNRAAYAGRASAPALSLAGGRYAGESVTVTITVPEGTTVRYTVNGNFPDSKDPVYEGPLTLTETTALTAAAFADGLLPSESVCATYLLGLDLDTPVVCLIVERAYLFSSTDGILAKGTGSEPNYEQNWEYPGIFEYFDESGACVLSQRCGIGVQGNSSRANLQKSFQLAARKAYGSNIFAFNPFSNRDFTGYKSLNLRCAGSEGNTSTRMRDAYLTSLAEGTHLLYSAAQPVLVYINGMLWGQYNLRERMNKHFITQHLGITDNATEDGIDLLSENGDVIHNGDDDDYKALSRFMRKNDLNIPENLDYALSQMDVDSYFDYICFVMITGNRDLSNTRFYRVPGGKWTWLLCDLDRALQKVDNASAFWLYTLPISHAQEYMTDHVPFAALMKVPAMKEKFLARMGELLCDKFTPAKLTAGIDAWSARLAPLIPYHMERWQLASVRYWEQEVKEMRAIAQERPALIVGFAQKYFKLTDEETQRYFGAFLELL